MTTKSTTFFDGLFLRGDLPPAIPSPWAAYIWETLPDLAARLTDGEEVGVGELSVYLELDDEDCEALAALGGDYEPRSGVAHSFSGTSIFIPGVGFWVCVPLYRDGQEAMQAARELQWAWEWTVRDLCDNEDLDVDPGDVVIDIVLLPIDEGPWDLRGINPRHAYLPYTFKAFSEALRARALACDPDALNAAVRFLVENGYIRDAKEPSRYEDEWVQEVPEWLTEYLPLELADPCHGEEGDEEVVVAAS